MLRLLNQRTIALLTALIFPGLAVIGPVQATTVTGGDTNLTPLGLSVVGLDSNDVMTGPNVFPIGARYCATTALTGVTATWQWQSGGSTTNDSLIRLADSSTATTTIGSLAAGSCYEAYWNVEVARTTDALRASRAYQITFTSGTTTLGSTNIDRRIYVAPLISSNRDKITSFTLDENTETLTAGNIYHFTMTADVPPADLIGLAGIFPTSTFQVLSTSFTYTNGNDSTTSTSDTGWASACDWKYIYDEQGAPGQCAGTANVQGEVTAHFTVKVLADATAGNVSLAALLVYDNTGNAWHYTLATVLILKIIIPAPELVNLTTAVVGSGTLNVGVGTTTYVKGSQVTLVATPATGWRFSAWSGDCSGTNATYVVTLTTSKSCTATFVQLPQETTTATPTPTVTVTVTPSPLPTVTVTQPVPGPTVTVTQTPTPAPTVTVTQTVTPSPLPTVTVTQAVPGPTTTVGVPVPGPTVTVTATPAPAPTVTVTATPAPAPTVTVTQTAAPAPTVTVTATVTATPSATTTVAPPEVVVAGPKLPKTIKTGR